MAARELVPQVTFKTRVRDESVDGPNPFRWEDVTSQQIFGGWTLIFFEKSFIFFSSLKSLKTLLYTLSNIESTFEFVCDLTRSGVLLERTLSRF